MARLDENSLICDLAETYHIFDWRALPARLAATLACGLRDDSRIKLKTGGAAMKLETLLLASAVDCLRILVWRQTADGVKGKNAPVLFTELLSGQSSSRSGEGFDDPADFMLWREKMIGGGANG